LAQFDQFVVHSEMEKQKQVDILKKENNHPWVLICIYPLLKKMFKLLQNIIDL
jgi:hypothetical protein